MIAVRLADLRDALGRLDNESRSTLEAAFRQGRADDGAERAFERLADELALDGREARDELFATLHDIPAEYWES